MSIFIGLVEFSRRRSWVQVAPSSKWIWVLGDSPVLILGMVTLRVPGTPLEVGPGSPVYS